MKGPPASILGSHTPRAPLEKLPFLSKNVANADADADADNVTDTSLFCLLVQTNSADGFNLVLIHISEKLNGLDVRIVYTQHDEIIIEARGAKADQVLTIVKESMEEALKRIIPEAPFVAEIRVADSWGDKIQ